MATPNGPFEEGYLACTENDPHCPYITDSVAYSQWWRGYDSARDDEQNEDEIIPFKFGKYEGKIIFGENGVSIDIIINDEFYTNILSVQKTYEELGLIKE